jgi:hypothetical protein
MKKQTKKKKNFDYNVTKFYYFYDKKKDKEKKEKNKNLEIQINEKEFSNITTKIEKMNNDLFMMNLSISKLFDLYNHVKYRIIVTNLNFDILYCNPIWILTNPWKLEGSILLYNNIRDMHNELYHKKEIQESFEKVHYKTINENIDVVEVSKVFYGDIKVTFIDEQIFYKSKKMGYLFKVILTDKNRVEIVIN